MYIYILCICIKYQPFHSLGSPHTFFSQKEATHLPAELALQVDYDKLRHHPVLPRFFELPQWKVQAPSPLALSLLRCQVTGILGFEPWDGGEFFVRKMMISPGKIGISLWNKWWFHQTKMGVKWTKIWLNHHQKGFNQEQLRFMQWKMDLTMRYGGFDEE